MTNSILFHLYLSINKPYAGWVMCDWSSFVLNLRMPEAMLDTTILAPSWSPRRWRDSKAGYAGSTMSFVMAVSDACACATRTCSLARLLTRASDGSKIAALSGDMYRRVQVSAIFECPNERVLEVPKGARGKRVKIWLAQSGPTWSRLRFSRGHELRYDVERAAGRSSLD